MPTYENTDAIIAELYTIGNRLEELYRIAHQADIDAAKFGERFEPTNDGIRDHLINISSPLYRAGLQITSVIVGLEELEKFESKSKE